MPKIKNSIEIDLFRKWNLGTDSVVAKKPVKAEPVFKNEKIDSIKKNCGKLYWL